MLGFWGSEPLEIVVVLLLEKKTRKNSSNSGLPPSRNSGANGNRNKDNDDRAKKGEQLENTRKVTTSEVVSPSTCSECDASLTATKASKTEERKKIDIIYEIVEHTVSAEVKVGPACSHTNKAKFPEGMDGKLQYGIGIKASIINFLMIQMISLERTQEHFKGLIGRFISQSIMLKYLTQFSTSLEG